MNDAADRPAYGSNGSRSNAASSDAESVVRVFVDAELGGVAQRDVVREDGEDGKRHARRAAILRRLVGG